MMSTRTEYATLLVLLVLASPMPARADSAENVTRHQRIVPTDGAVNPRTGLYVYDPSGSIAAIGESWYVYDPIGRVVTASVDRFGNVQTQTYAYDVYGNRTSDGVTAYNASSSTNRLISLGAQYDVAGNLTQWQPPYSTTPRRHSYDALNTMMMEKVAVSGGDEYVAHLYTADDERYWSFQGGASNAAVSRYTLRDLGGRVLREFSEPAVNDWSARDYVYREGLALASHDTRTGDAHHYSLDHLGTPRVVTNQDAEKVAEHTYFPFGAEYTDDSPTDGRLHFAGHEQRDKDLLGQNRGELDYMHARYYSADLARFVSTDPVLDFNSALHSPQAWNRYTYARNRPGVYIDPDGRLAVPWHFGITYVAARRNGMGFGRSVALAFSAAAVDFRKGSQSARAANTNMHAMRGSLGNVDQTIAEGRAGTTASVRNSVASGDWAAALHTVQDAATPLHQDHLWPGSYAGLGLRDALAHFFADLFPSASTVRTATANSEALLAGTPVESIPLFRSNPLPSPWAYNDPFGRISGFHLPGQGALIDGVWYWSVPVP